MSAQAGERVGRRALFRLARSRAVATVPSESAEPSLQRPQAAAPAALTPAFRAQQRAALQQQGPRLVAKVLAFNCLVRTGCGSCAEHCPVPGALEISGGKVRIDATACDGCGRCREVCPAPQPAIELLPQLPAPAAGPGSGAGP